MKKFMTMIAIALSISAFAKEEVNFTYTGFEGWGFSYYSCDYVLSRTEKVIEMFGGTQGQVECTGGIEIGRVWAPINVSVRFEAPMLQGNEVAQVVKYKGDTWNPSCGLNVKIVRELLPKFPNVKVLKKSDSCSFASTSYSYDFSIVK